MPAIKAPNGQRYKHCCCSCVGVSAEWLDAAQHYTHKNELSGGWDGDTFWGTKAACDVLRAFCDGWRAHLIYDVKQTMARNAELAARIRSENN